MDTFFKFLGEFHEAKYIELSEPYYEMEVQRFYICEELNTVYVLIKTA
jgi:hypothetical protein